MGEYATYRGQRIKIGTCEDMLYLRWDQASLVTPERGSLNPTDPDTLKVIRFRFPWPDEDNVRPGEFEDFDRGYPLRGFTQPPDLDHGLVQFRADNGYLLSIPCPEGPDAETLTFQQRIGTQGYKPVAARIHRNGYGGPAGLVQQAWRNGRLVGIARCNGCNDIYRLEDKYVNAAVESLGAGKIADRLLAGYALERVA